MSQSVIHPDMLAIVNQLLPSYPYLSELRTTVGITTGSCLTPSVIQRVSQMTGSNSELMPEAVSFLDMLNTMELFYGEAPDGMPLTARMVLRIIAVRTCPDPSKLLNAEQAGEFFVADHDAALHLILANHVLYAALIYCVFHSLVGRA